MESMSLCGAHLKLARSWMYLIGLQAPPNYGAEYKTAFDQMYPDLAKKYGTLLYENFFAGLIEGTDRAAALRKFMQPDGIHPNAKGVTILVAQIGPSVEALISKVQ